MLVHEGNRVQHKTQDGNHQRLVVLHRIDCLLWPVPNTMEKHLLMRHCVKIGFPDQLSAEKARADSLSWLCKLGAADERRFKPVQKDKWVASIYRRGHHISRPSAVTPE